MKKAILFFVLLLVFLLCGCDMISKGYLITFKNDDGTILSEQQIKKGKKLSLPENPSKEGYTFDGWYVNEEKWDFDNDVIKDSIVLTAKWSINQYTLTIKLNNGAEDIAITQDYDTAITAISNPEREGYTCGGWSENIPTKMPPVNKTIEAKWTVNKYTITLDNQAKGVAVSGITSGREYEFGSQITLSATNLPAGHTIMWTRSDGVVDSGENYSFKAPATDITITTTITYTREENKIYYGTYPQTEVSDDTLINELNVLAGTKPTSTDSYNWTDYHYYISSSITSFMFYQDIDYDNDGTYDYRGVYFTQYRPCYYFDSSSNSCQEINGYSTNTIYWFNYDPIEWDILEEKDGKAFIIANLILDSQDYYPSSDTSAFSHNGDTGYANNYELSNVRKWLNETFYNTAFIDLQESLIETTIVDNSVASTGQSSNSYVCNNTNDKMFLLSYIEATTYYTSPTDIRAIGTDYAKAQGLSLYVNTFTNDFSWLSRTPYEGNSVMYAACVRIVDGDSFCCGDVFCTAWGVRPACWINLK